MTTNNNKRLVARLSYAHPLVRSAHAAFTLIELLVVIAIISILAAIIFPVFSTAQENARESNTMARLHDVAAGLALYKLDNKSYPPVLFAYACDTNSTDSPKCNPNDTMATIGADANAKNELVGLYPEYVKNWQDFTCNNDNVDDPNGIRTSGSALQPNYFGVDGTLKAADGTADRPYRSYFLKDAMDVSPRILDTNKIADPATTTNFIIRYQTSWSGMCAGWDPATAPTLGLCDQNYTRQLRWTNPPANTFVTGITYHVPNSNKLIVMYESGTVRKVDAQLAPPTQGWDDSATTIAPASGSSAANFWKFDATGH